MGWAVRGSNPGGGGLRFSAPVKTGPGAHPASCTIGTGSFLGLKQPGCGVDHPPPSSAKVKERVELYLYSPSGVSWYVLGWALLWSLTFKWPVYKWPVYKWPVYKWPMYKWPVYKCISKNIPMNSLYTFRQEQNLLHFLDMLHNLCFIFHKMTIIL